MKNCQKIFSKIIISGFLLFTLILPLQAFGLAAGGIGILPANPDPNNNLSKSWFIYTMDRGQTKVDAVNVFNNSDDEVVVKVYPVDGTTTADGNFTLIDESAEQKGIGAWVNLFAYEVGLKPHEVKKIPFTISVPANADVGDHMGGLIIQEVSRGPAGAKREGMMMSIVTRIGARIYLTVPGERVEKLSITDFGSVFITRTANFWKKLLNINYVTSFLITLKNEGNVRIEPETKIKITNIFGKTVDEIGGQIGMVFPKSSSKLNLIWEKPLFFGRYVATAKVKFSQDQEPATKKIIFWAVPYKFLTILGGLIVLVILLRLIFLYFVELSKEKMLIYELSKKETVQEVAEKFKVNWAKLARLNRLKKPYELKNGQKLFIPANRRNKELLKVLLDKGVMEPSIQDKLGKVKKSIFYKIHQGKKSLKIIMIAVVILVVGGGLIWLFFNQAKKQAVVPTGGEITQPEAAKDLTRTRGGVLKRSEIKLAVYNNASTSENVEKLIKKLQFVGFKVEKTNTRGKESYEKTTLEHKKDPENNAGLEAARGVVEALGIKNEDVDFIEIEGLPYDVEIAYFVGDVFDLELPELTAADLKILEPVIGQATSTATTTSTLLNKAGVTITVLNGGAPAGSASQVANQLKNAGFTNTTSGNAASFDYQGVTIYYQENSASAAQEIKDVLSSSYSNIKLEQKADLTINVQVILGS